MSMLNCDSANSQFPIDIRFSSLENNLKIEETSHLEFLRIIILLLMNKN